MRALALILSFVVSINARAEQIDKIVKDLNTAFQCPERIWPGFTGESFRIVFTSSKQSWLWTPESKTVENLTSADYQIPEESFSYTPIEFRGGKAVAVNVDLNRKQDVPSLAVSEAAKTAFHEGFHYLYQFHQPWLAYYSGRSERTQEVDHAKVIYYRLMLIRALKKELLANKGFGRSAFWYQKWLALGQTADTKFHDIFEGTAYYAELMFSVLAAKGCEISEQELVRTALSNVSSLVDRRMSIRTRAQAIEQYLATSYNLESYEIGLLSLLALRTQGRLVGIAEYPHTKNLQEEMKNAKDVDEQMKIYEELQANLATVRTPCELLLKDVNPIPDSENLRLLAEIRQAFKLAKTAK